MYLHLFFSFHFCFCVAVEDTCLIWQFTFLVFFGFFICKRLAALDAIELELIQCIHYDSDYRFLCMHHKKVFHISRIVAVSKLRIDICRTHSHLLSFDLLRTLLAVFELRN